MNDKPRDNRIAVSASNLEQDTSNAALRAKKIKGLNPPYDINVHCLRKRKCDIDGISAKAAIDGLVKGGIFFDDSATYIQKISYSQEQTKGEEKTLITIREAVADPYLEIDRLNAVIERLKNFPSALRKMWTGDEVRRWLEDNSGW